MAFLFYDLFHYLCPTNSNSPPQKGLLLENNKLYLYTGLDKIAPSFSNMSKTRDKSRGKAQILEMLDLETQIKKGKGGTSIRSIKINNMRTAHIPASKPNKKNRIKLPAAYWASEGPIEALFDPGL